MSQRSFTVPVAALGLTLGSGCTSPLVGEWELTEAGGYSWPVEDSYTEDGVTYTLRGEGRLTVEKDLDVEFELKLTYSAKGGGESYSTSYSYTYDGDAKALKARGQYEIELSGDGDLNLDCALAKDELDCESDDDEIIRFERT